MMIDFETLKILSISLGIGLMVGIERGWKTRDMHEGERSAGVRTFPLIGLSGGLTGILSQTLGASVVFLVFLGFAALLVTSYYLTSKKKGSGKGITTEVAAITVFLLCTLASLGHATIAAALGVITVSLLGFKPTLHQWVAKLESEELISSLKLLLIAIVALPLLPNKTYGPWETFNPFEIGWMVVLIAFISYVGYIGVKIIGTRRGLRITALFGGLASSTAVALSFSRLAKTHASLKNLLSGGIVLASSIMFPRIFLEVAVINPEMLLPLTPPLLCMLLVSLSVCWWMWRSQSEDFQGGHGPSLKNPFELLPALQFGLLLALIMFLAKTILHFTGEEGIYLLSLISGVVDVDAITLSLARMSGEDLTSESAIKGIIIAAMSNTIFKTMFFTILVRGREGKRMIFGLLAILLAGGLGLYLAQFLDSLQLYLLQIE